MKFCKDCALYEGYEAGPDGRWSERCNRPIEPQYDLVSGEQTNKYDVRSPKQERYEAGPGKPVRCGAGATYFIPRLK